MVRAPLVLGLVLSAAAPSLHAEGDSAAAALAASLPGLGLPEAPSELFAMELGDQDVSLFLSGSWTGTLTAAGGLALTDLGLQASSEESPLLFTQEVDLSLSLVVSERWLVEASFLDDYDLNTYRTAYVGKEGETLRYLGIGNTGLDFPAFPFLSLSGATASSFGAYGALDFGGTQMHSLVRYDFATSSSKDFRGSRELVESDKSPSERLAGRLFVLPQESLGATPTVYVEDEADGVYTGSDGRKYRVATAAEASASALLGLVRLAEDWDGRVAVAWDGLSASAIDSAQGDWASPGSFLGSVQDAFSASSAAPDLSAYPAPGEGTGAVSADKPGAITIAGAGALVVWESGTFSPFEVASRYAAPTSSGDDLSVALVYSSSGDGVSGYSVFEELDTLPALSASEDSQSTQNVYRLVRTDEVDSSDYRSATVRFPLAAEAPGSYLSAASRYGSSSGDGGTMVLRFTSLGDSDGESAYSIGTDAIAGSIQVWRGGVPDLYTSYDSDTGYVTLSSAASDGELVHIEWLDSSSDSKVGSLAAALGAKSELPGGQLLSGALGLRWNLSQSSFTDEDSSSPGNVSASVGIEKESEHYRYQAALGLVLENPDTTGRYRAAGMEGEAVQLAPGDGDCDPSLTPDSPSSPADDYLALVTAFDASATPSAEGEYGAEDPPDAANQKELPYRDYTQTDLLGNSALKTIDWTGSSLDESQDGPYPVSMTGGSAEALVAEYELGYGADEDGAFALWAGYQWELGSLAATVASANRLRIPLRAWGVATDSDPVDVYLQIGILGAEANEDEDFDGRVENPELVVTKRIFGTGDDEWPSGSDSSGAWTIVTVDFTSEERRLLAGATSARLIVRLRSQASVDYGDDLSTVSASGRVLVGPISAEGASFRPVINSGSLYDAELGGAIEAVETLDLSAESPGATLATAYADDIALLHPDDETQRILYMDWDATGLGIDAAVGAEKDVSSVPLGSYRELDFFVRGPEFETDGAGSKVGVFFLEDDDASLDDAVLAVTVPVSELGAGVWHKVSASYGASSNKVSIDGTEIPGASVTGAYATATSASRTPTRIVFAVLPPEGLVLDTGSAAFDELVFREPALTLAARAQAAGSWSRKGVVLGALGLDLLADPEVEGSLYSTFADAEHPLSVYSSASAKGKILGADALLRGALVYQDGETSVSGGHELAIPLGPLTLSDDFSYGDSGSTTTIGPYDRKTAAAISTPLGGGSNPARLQASVSAEAERSADGSDAMLDKTISFNAGVAALLGGRRSPPPGAGPPGDPAAPAGSIRTLSASAKASLSSSRNADDELSYPSAFSTSLLELLPGDGIGAKTRKMSFSAGAALSGGLLGFELSASGARKVSASGGSARDSAAMELGLPIALGSSTATVSVARSFSAVTDYDSGSGYRDDAEALGSRFYAALPLLLAPPGTDLTLDYGSSDFAAFADDADSGAFSSRASIAWSRKPAGWGIDLLAPGKLRLSAVRADAKSLDELTRSLSGELALSTSAINLFGSKGSSSLFGLYESDEFLHTETFDIGRDVDGDLSWSLALDQNALFLGGAFKSFEASQSLRLSSDDWSEALDLVLKLDAPASLAAKLYAFALGKAAVAGSPLAAALASGPVTGERRFTFSAQVEDFPEGAWDFGAGFRSSAGSPGTAEAAVFATLELSGGDGDDTALGLTAGISLKFSF